MTDLDILTRVPAPGWRPPYRLLVGGAATPQDVATAALRSLTRSLRSGGGLPAADALAGVVSQFNWGHISLTVAFGQFSAIERSTVNHRHTKVAAEAARRLVVELGQNGALVGDPMRAVAERCCWALVEHHLFGRARPELVGRRFADHAAAVA